MMKLIKSADIKKFLAAVQGCTGGVYFTTSEGDYLNLRSQLSQLVFAAAASAEKVLDNYCIILDDPGDKAALAAFLE